MGRGQMQRSRAVPGGSGAARMSPCQDPCPQCCGFSHSAAAPAWLLLGNTAFTSAGFALGESPAGLLLGMTLLIHSDTEMYHPGCHRAEIPSLVMSSAHQSSGQPEGFRAGVNTSPEVWKFTP